MSRPAKVLYIEDNGLDQRAFARLVRDRGLPWDVTMLETLAAARAALAASHFDVIVADHHLPDGDSTDLFDEITDTPFVLIAGTLEEQLALRTLERGADDYLRRDATGGHLEALPFTVEKTLYRKAIHERERQLTRELREREQRLRATFENAASGIIQADEQDRIVAVNERLCQMLGYSREELLGMNVHDLTWLEDRPRRDALSAQLHEGRAPMVRYEKRYLKRDGSPLWVELAVSAVRDEAGRYLYSIGTVLDISARKAAEAQVRLHAAALEAAPNAISLSKTDPKGTIVWVNPAFTTLTGYNAEEAIGHSHHILSSGRQDDAFYRELWETVERGEAWHGELTNRRKDGTLYHEEMGITPLRDEQGKVTHYVAIKQDITARKRVEQELRENERHLRTLADQLETRARLGQLRADVAQTLQRPGEAKRVLQAVAELLVDRLDAALVRVWTHNATAQRLELQASAGLYTHLNGPHSRIPVGHFRIGAIAQERHAQVTSQVIGDPQVHDQEWARREGLVAFAGHPLVLDDHLLGVVAVFARHTLSNEVVDTLDAVSNLLAQALGRKQAEAGAAELRNRLAADLAGMRRLHEVSMRMAGRADLHPLLLEIVDAALFVTSAAKGDIQLLDEASGTLKITAHRGFEQPFLDFFSSISEGDAACGESMRRGERVIVEDVTQSPFHSEAARAAMLAAGVRAVVTTPLVCRSGRLVGMLSTHYSAVTRPPERELRWLDLLGRQAADFIERVESEAALRESEAKFRVVSENAHAIFGIIQGGRYISVNPYLAEITGYSMEEIYSMPVSQLVHPSFRDMVMDRARRRLVGEPVPAHYEFILLTKSGESRWLDFSAERIELNGKPAIIGTAFDITDRKRVEDELREAKAAAEQASKAKDHFLAVLSHELRTPLTPVLAAVSILQDDSRLDADVQESLEMICRNVELEARLIDDLLDVTRIARGKIELHRQPVQFCEVIRRAVEVCKPDIEARRLQFGVDLGPAAPCIVVADVARLQQVFWNLLKNSIKFTPPGGCVGIRCYAAGGHVIAEVIDSGSGIEPEALPRIFNAFEQAERSITRQFGGLGLGLTISKALVEMHGGSIEAHSAGKGRGATFRVKLPVVSLQSPVGEPRGTSLETGSSKPETRPLRVLLVEDHGDTAQVLARILKRQGHEVQTAGDVATALELAGRQSFDLLISDLGLPDRSGVDLIQDLRSRGQTLPAIALSGYGQDEDVKRSRDAGFNAHLTKPVDFDLLRKTVTAVRSGPQAASNSTAEQVARSALAGTGLAGK